MNFSDPTVALIKRPSISNILTLCVSLFRYLALESMCLLATSEFSHEAVKKHLETVILALKVKIFICTLSSPAINTLAINTR